MSIIHQYISTTPSTPVTFPLSQDVIKHALEALEWCKNNSNALGLAGNQLGYNEAFFIMLLNNKFECIFNPKIIGTHGYKQYIEHCFSVSGAFKIKRNKEITVEYEDFLGSIHRVHLKGREAQIFQHEFWHTKGQTIASMGQKV